MLEMSVPLGLDAQKVACGSVFDKLWRALGENGQPLARVERDDEETYASYVVCLPDIPRCQLGHHFVRVWRAELQAAEELNDMEE